MLSVGGKGMGVCSCIYTMESVVPTGSQPPKKNVQYRPASASGSSNSDEKSSLVSNEGKSNAKTRPIYS